MPITQIAVYLGSNCGNRPVFTETARLLGEKLAQNEIGVIYGGTSVGTMNALADGVILGKGKLTGVIPAEFITKSIKYDNLTQLIVVKDLKERKSRMEEMSDACLILPGSYGTMDEFFEYAVNHQLGYHSKPLFLLNLDDFYTPLLQQLDVMEQNGFLSPGLKALIQVCNSIDQLIESIKVVK